MAYESPWQDPNQQYPSMDTRDTPNNFGGSFSGDYGMGGNTYDQSGNTLSGGGTYTTDPSFNTGYNTGGSSQGGFDWGGLANSAGQWLTGGGGSNVLGALPLAGMAAQQFNNARRYENIGQDAARMADPFGSQRAQYQTRLSDIYNDPAKVLADPQHQAIMNSQLDKIQARNRAGGYMGGGKDFTDQADYAAQENAKYLNDEKARLAMLSGAQFDPGTGAGMMMKGAELGMNAQNGALGALGMMYQNALGAPSGTMNRPGMGGSQGGGLNPQQLLQQGGGGYSPQQLQQMASGAMGQQGLNAYQQLINGNMPGGGSFTANQQSPYWSQFTQQNYNPNQIGQQELQVTQGNQGGMYDEFGGLNPGYGGGGNYGNYDPSWSDQSGGFGSIDNTGDYFGWYGD